MTKVVVLIAFGPNSVQVPCRIFQNLDEAIVRCKELFNHEKMEFDEKILSWTLDHREFDLPEEIVDKIFTYYYGGCGEAYSFRLMEIPFDEKFVGFDLD